MKDEITAGMEVRDAEGKRLGIVVVAGDTAFIVARGWLVQKEYTLDYDLVSEVDDQDTVRLRVTRKDLDHSEHDTFGHRAA